MSSTSLGHGARTRFRRGVATIAATATAATLGISIAPAAQAATPDDATKAVNALLTALATDFVPEMASSTALSQQLPTLAVTPAESVELRSAFPALVSAGGALEKIGEQGSLQDLASYIAGRDVDGWELWQPMSPSERMRRISGIFMVVLE